MSAVSPGGVNQSTTLNFFSSRRRNGVVWFIDGAPHQQQSFLLFDGAWAGRQKKRRVVGLAAQPELLGFTLRSSIPLRCPTQLIPFITFISLISLVAFIPLKNFTHFSSFCWIWIWFFVLFSLLLRSIAAAAAITPQQRKKQKPNPFNSPQEQQPINFFKRNWMSWTVPLGSKQRNSFLFISFLILKEKRKERKGWLSCVKYLINSKATINFTLLNLCYALS